MTDMNIHKNWKIIQKVFEYSIESTLHYALSTINEDGSPHITPISTLFLRDDLTGFFFDQFSVNMSKNLDRDQRVCVMAVQSDAMYWLPSLVEGRFLNPPAVRVMGRVKKRRKATPQEIDMWQRKVAYAKSMKGYKMLWKNMRHVRDIEFDDFKPVFMGEMTQDLWIQTREEEISYG